MSELDQPKWYILHTYSGYEAMVKDSLEKLIENNNLGDYIVDLKIPMEQVIEEKNGKRKVVERKLLPCYVFIKMIYTNQIWYYVTSTRGVTGFCGPQGRPIPMKEEEIRKMRLEEFVSDVDFKVGDTVSIEEGPLKGFLGPSRNSTTRRRRRRFPPACSAAIPTWKWNISRSSAWMRLCPNPPRNRKPKFFPRRLLFY